jgi:hypothetical protein
MKGAAEPEELCLKEQYNSIGVCRNTQEREEWRKGETGGGEEVLGKEGVTKSEQIGSVSAEGMVVDPYNVGFRNEC